MPSDDELSIVREPPIKLQIFFAILKFSKILSKFTLVTVAASSLLLFSISIVSRGKPVPVSEMLKSVYSFDFLCMNLFSF